MDVKGNLNVTGDITTDGTVDGIDIATDVAANTSKTSYTDAAAVSANTAKVTNATHTSEVTGATALALNKVAISNKSLVTAAVGDHVLVGDLSDSDNLKKVTVQTIVDLAAAGGASVVNDLDDAVTNDSATGYFFMGYNGSTYTGNGATGQANLGIGPDVMMSLSSGFRDTAIGNGSMRVVTSSAYSCSYGWQSSYQQTSGNGENSSYGASAYQNGSTGSRNSFFGYISGACTGTNQVINHNSGFGKQSLRALKTGGDYNSAVGSSSGANITTGSYVSIIGYNSGTGITTGDGCSILGANVSGLATGLTDNIILARGTDGLIRAQHDDTAWNFKTAFGTPQNTLTDATTIVLNSGLSMSHTVVLDGNRTMGTPSNSQCGVYTFKIVQDASVGSRTVTWDAVFNFAGGTAPTLSTGVNDIDIITFYCDGTNYFMTSATLNHS